MNPWQPIETAPKDGSWIVVASTWNPYARACLQYRAELGGWIDSNDEIDESASGSRDLADRYTHWLPLPPLPATVTSTDNPV